MGWNPLTGQLEQTSPPLRLNPLTGQFQFGASNRLVFDPLLGTFVPAKAGGVPFVGPLDSVAADCLFAYATGVRLFSASDPTWTIRRASDSVTQVFTTDPTTGVWGSDVLAFLGAAQGVVAASVDQKGGLVLAQATGTSQPQMATGGALTTFNGGNFGTLHTGDSLVSSVNLAAIPQPFTVVARLNTSTANNNAGPFSTVSGFRIYYSSFNWALGYNAGNTVTTEAVQTGVPLTLTVVFNGASSQFYINGVLEQTFDIGTSADAIASVVRVGVGLSGVYSGSYAFAGIWNGVQNDGTIETLLSTIWP